MLFQGLSKNIMVLSCLWTTSLMASILPLALMIIQFISGMQKQGRWFEIAQWFCIVRNIFLWLQVYCLWLCWQLNLYLECRNRGVYSGPLARENDTVMAVAYFSNSKHIVSGSDENTICVWDAETGNMSCELLKKQNSHVYSVAYYLWFKRQDNLHLRF